MNEILTCEIHLSDKKHHHDPSGQHVCCSHTDGYTHCAACAIGADAFIGSAIGAHQWWNNLTEWWNNLTDQERVKAWNLCEFETRTVVAP